MSVNSWLAGNTLGFGFWKGDGSGEEGGRERAFQLPMYDIQIGF